MGAAHPQARPHPDARPTRGQEQRGLQRRPAGQPEKQREAHGRRAGAHATGHTGRPLLGCLEFFQAAGSALREKQHRRRSLVPTPHSYQCRNPSAGTEPGSHRFPCIRGRHGSDRDRKELSRQSECGLTGPCRALKQVPRLQFRPAGPNQSTIHMWPLLSADQEVTRVETTWWMGQCRVTWMTPGCLLHSAQPPNMTACGA